MVFHLLCADLFSSTIDGILQAALYDQIAAGVPSYQVPALVKAFRGECSRVVFWRVKVPPDGVRSTDREFTYFALWDLVTIIIHNSYLISGRNGPSLGIKLHLVWVI